MASLKFSKNQQLQWEGFCAIKKVTREMLEAGIIVDRVDSYGAYFDAETGEIVDCQYTLNYACYKLMEARKELESKGKKKWWQK